MPVDPTGAAGIGFKLLASRRRRKAGPVAEIRECLTATRRGFNDITAAGGKRSDYFSPDDAFDEELTDLSRRTTDKHLSLHLRTVAKCWTEAFASAPPPRGPRVYPPAGPVPDSYRRKDEMIRQAFERQMDAAHKGLDAVQAALDRLNRLERKTL